MLHYWFIFLALSLGVSLVMLLFIQIRLLVRERRPTEHPPRAWQQTFWTDLSPIQRILTYTGIVAVVVTIVGDVALKLFRGV